jgi:hypothetical protein
MAEGDYPPEPYRPTFPLDFNSQHYEYQKQKYRRVSDASDASGYGGAPSGADITNLLKADLYISGQTVESILAMIGHRYTLKKRIQGELQHLKYDLQDRINQTMYFGDRLPTMVKRRSDLEKQLLQMGTEGLREDQAFWKDISLLAKELRYKLEQYKKEKAKGDFL